MVFERDLEDNLFELHDELLSGHYVHSPYEPFTIHDPKQRTIHKAQVRDRVVHQAIINVVEPIFEKRFIHDSYSCRVGKGTHAAVRRLHAFLRSASQNDKRTIYATKCDVRKFFASVNHGVLLQLLQKHVPDPAAMNLIEHIVKSFSVSPGVGLPLGNLTSQLFANVYLHELDWYIKQTLRVRRYLRYCDDFVMIAPSMKEGFDLADKVNVFLKSHLKIELHPGKVRVKTWAQGIDFLGYVILPQATIVRPDTARRMVQKVKESNITSYLGVCTHANSHKLQQLLLNRVG